MNSTSRQARRKRLLVGVLSATSLLAGIVGLTFISVNSAWAATCLRVGIVLGAIWLALPSRQREAAWSRLSRWKLAGIATAAILIPRLKFMLPLIAVGFLAGWLIRPRRRTTRISDVPPDQTAV